MTKQNYDWSVLQGNNRPRCDTPGCENHAAPTGRKNKDGHTAWRRSNKTREKYPGTEGWICHSCIADQIKEKHGVTNLKEISANRKGLTVTQYQNKSHRYLKYRKDHCENIDGRLGFQCTYEPPNPRQLNEMGGDVNYQGWLQVDHIDGDPSNNLPSNLQTLCANCHTVKTHLNKDHKTPGRKTLINA